MSVKKLDDGRYEVDIRPTGRNGKRIRRKLDKKSEAMAFEKHTQYNHHSKGWLSKPTDKRQLSELKELWWKLMVNMRSTVNRISGKLSVSKR